MMQKIEFFVNGTPKGQPRPRAFSRGGHARVYDPGTAEGWKSQIALAWRDYQQAHVGHMHSPIAGPLRLSLTFVLPRPKAHYKKTELRSDAPLWCEKKPDADNYAKAVMDACTELGVWGDDSQVCALNVKKIYGSPSGCEIQIGECAE
jgi:Holliday junction resolvase RusA-like endonuclease